MKLAYSYFQPVLNLIETWDLDPIDFIERKCSLYSIPCHKQIISVVTKKIYGSSMHSENGKKRQELFELRQYIANELY